MFRKKIKVSRSLRIRTIILFMLLVVMPILWFYSINSDYYSKVKKNEAAMATTKVPAEGGSN